MRSIFARPLSLEQCAELAIKKIEASDESFGGYSAQQIAQYIRGKTKKKPTLSIGFAEYQNGSFEMFIQNRINHTNWHLEKPDITHADFVGLRDVLECSFILSATPLTTEVHKN